MFVYAHWTREGHQHLQAFNKAERAADYAYNQINNYVAHEERNYGPYADGGVVGRGQHVRERPAELNAVRAKLEELKNEKTLEQVQKLIGLYEDYCRHVVGQESPLHAIKDIAVVE
jgi:adenine-specific DNA methylase